MSELKRWMNATSPICNSLVSSLVKPSVVLQRSISADRIARRNNRNAQFKAAVSRCIKYRSRLGTESTHCLTGCTGNTCSTKCAAVSFIRLVQHEGQTPRPLQENATIKSWPQSPQRAPAKPCANTPHSKHLRKACSTNRGGV
jgi:hydroxypyruvate isomerase